MPGALEGKVIIVAGAGGIGSGLAHRFAAEGAAVVVGDVFAQAAAETADAIVAAGGRARALTLDGADDGSVAAAVAAAVDTYGGLDGFHANFACFRDGEHGGDVLNLPLEVYDEVMRVNARGFVLCTRHALPAMISSGGGSMLYTSSGAAHQGLPQHSAYAMSKAAVHALMRHVATRFGRCGIRANVIAPGVVTHPRFEAVMEAEAVAQMSARVPIGRLGKPDDIAAMAALLMSDAGSFVTGQVISVDGGASMRP